jgi:transcriptional/translational regulatory protein YebC/TACO1
MVAIEAGAEDISIEGDSIEVTTGPSEFEAVRDALEKAGARIENAEVTMHPKSTVPVGEDKAAGVLRLMEALEEDDDVQQVYANFDIPADVLERVSANV